MFFYPFTLPAVKPRTNCFCKIKNAMTSGRDAITILATTSVQFVVVIPENSSAPPAPSSYPCSAALYWQHKLIPHGPETDNGTGRNDRFAHRRYDLSKNLPCGRTVYVGRFVQTVTDTFIKCHDQENCKRDSKRCINKNQTGSCIVQPTIRTILKER